MKKYIALVFVLVCVLGLAGCSDTNAIFNFAGASKYLYKLLYSDDISLPTIDGTICWTRKTASDRHSYVSVFSVNPLFLSGKRC